MKRWFLFLTLALLILPLVTALDFQKHKQDTNLDFAITSNNATGCNLTTINNPSNITTINQEGTKNFQTFNFSIDGANYSDYGVYCHNIECTDGVKIESGQKCYEVNYFGKELTESQSILYLGLLGILIFTLFISFMGIRQLPDSNAKDEFGRIMSINYLKHFRLVLWLVSYFLFIGIVYLASNIAFAFLSEQLFAKLLFAIFTVLFVLSPVVVILIVLSFFVTFFHDKQFQNLLNRGIFPGDQL